MFLGTILTLRRLDREMSNFGTENHKKERMDRF
jgi:hypothetical protein